MHTGVRASISATRHEEVRCRPHLETKSFPSTLELCGRSIQVEAATAAVVAHQVGEAQRAAELGEGLRVEAAAVVVGEVEQAAG